MDPEIVLVRASTCTVTEHALGTFGGIMLWAVPKSNHHLISANWNQGGQWNNMCPGETLVGCVAVAMGQVMYYWSNPTEGNGYTAYYHQEYGPISINLVTP